MNAKKLWSLLLAVVMSVTMLVSVASAEAVKPEISSEGKTVVTLWHTFTKGQKDMIDTIAYEFNAQSAEYYVAVESFPSRDFESKVRTAVVNGEGPDIIFHYSSEAANYVDGDNPENNLIVDLGKYISDPEIGIADWETSMDQVLLDETKGFADGLTHYVTLVRTGPILFYNKTILDELGLKVPTTWTELAETAKTISEKKPGVYGYAADSLTDMMPSLIMQNGSEYIDIHAKEAKIDNQITLDALNWYGKGVQDGYFMAAPTVDYYSNDMNNQLVAMYIGSCAGIPYLYPTENNWELGLAAMPQEGSERWYPAWNRGAFVFKSNETQEKGAYLFIKFFIQPENDLRFVQSVIALSPYYAVQQLDGYKELVAANPALQALESCLPDAGFLPLVNGASVVRTQLQSLAQMAGDPANNENIAALLTEATATCNDALQAE